MVLHLKNNQMRFVNDSIMVFGDCLSDKWGINKYWMYQIASSITELKDFCPKYSSDQANQAFAIPSFMGSV